MVRKYLNYIIFGVIVLGVIAFAVQHNQHIHSLVDAMAGSDQKAREQAALELIKAEQFLDTVTGEPVHMRVKAAESLEFVALDTEIKKGTEKDAPDYRANAVTQGLSLLKDLDKSVRERAVVTLQHSGAASSSTLSALVAGLKDGDNYVRRGTILALTEPGKGIGPKLDEAAKIDVIAAVVDIMKKEAGARGPGGDVLGSLLFRQGDAQKRSSDMLIAQFANKDGAVRQGAADALGKLGYVPAVPALIAAMHTDADPQVRRIAIGSLALIADHTCEDALVEAVSDVNADNEARAQAAAGLGRIASKRAIDTLVDSLGDDDLKLRSAAVGALSRAARPNTGVALNPAVVASLIHALQGANDDIRRGASQAFQSLGASEANMALIAVLKNTAYDTEARAAAATALGFPNNSAAIDPLVVALSDSDGGVNSAARDSLSAIGLPAADKLIKIIQSDGAEAYYATQALANLGGAVVPALARVADGNNRVGQHWAAVALGMLSGSGVQEARPVLQRLAKSSDEDVQYVATEQLHRLGMQ